MLLCSAGTLLGHQAYLQHRASVEAHEEELAKRTGWLKLRQQLRAEVGSFRGEVGLIVMDLGSGWKILHEPAKLFPSASLAKVPVMAACYLAAEQDRFKLDKKLTLRASDKLTGSGLLKDMPAGTAFSVNRLIGFMVQDSDNTATNMLTNLMGLERLNRMFVEMGLKNTKLSRKIADYDARDRRGVENYTTAEDMALLLEKMYRGQLGGSKVSEQCIHTLKLTRMNDRIPRYLPADLSIAHKTGLENGVCHDAGIVYTKKGDLLIVALTQHGNKDCGPSRELIGQVALRSYRYLTGEEGAVPESKKDVKGVLTPDA